MKISNETQLKKDRGLLPLDFGLARQHKEQENFGEEGSENEGDGVSETPAPTLFL